jgi:YesN/AraC family two-component response regulator
LKKAIQLLESENYSVSEVAYKVGFNDPSYFTRIFKKEYGKAPSEYVEKSLDI